MFQILNSVCTVTTHRLYSTANAGLMGPAVKLIFQHYDLNLSSVVPTGPKNNILKSDLLSFITANKLKPRSITVLATPAPDITSRPSSQSQKPKLINERNYVDIPLSNMRLTIAKRLSASKSTIPHSYQSTCVYMNNLLSLRKKFVKAGLKVSDLIIKAVALALRQVPQINVQWSNGKIIRVSSVDISVAVATPSGLITPIIFDADKLKVEEISNRLKELATRARDNKLKLQEFQGGSFTVSNLGMFGVSNFTAIINPPQTAILAVGGLRMELNEFDDPENILDVTLCFDARAITDLDAQNFLRIFKALIQDPETMIVGPDSFNNAGEMIDLF